MSLLLLFNLTEGAGGGGADPPVITTATLPNGYEGVPYGQTIAVTDGAPPLTFTVSVGALPNGLSLNASTGDITGTPTVQDTFNFTITVTDDDSQTDDQAYTVTISAAPAPSTRQGSRHRWRYRVTDTH